MLYGFVVVVHILMSLVLIAVVLLQGGRGGLSDALGGAAAQSLFGGGASTVMTKITAFCAGLFVVTSLSLAYLSTARGRSILEQIPMTAPGVLPILPPEHAPEAAPQAPGGTQATRTEPAQSPSSP